MLTDTDHSNVSFWSGIDTLYLALHVLLKNSWMTCISHGTDHMIPLLTNSTAVQINHNSVLLFIFDVVQGGGNSDHITNN